MAIRLRRGTAAQRITIIPEQAEVLYDTDTKNVWIGDNSTLGGTFVGGPGVVASVVDSANIDLDITANVLTADLTTTGVIANTYGGATLIPQLTVDAFGRITGVTNVSVSIPPTITLQTNSINNGSQSLLNLKDGTNITITDDGLGGITIDAAAGVTLETNGTPNSVQNLLDLVAGTNINLTESLGSVTIDASGGISHGTAAGTDTYTVTIAGVLAYNDGDAYLIRFTNGNTNAATLNINSLGAINLYRNNDGPLIGGDIWDGAEMLCVYNSTANIFQCIGTAPNSLFAYVTNDDSVTINKGEPVYAFSGTGNRMTVKLASNTSDATSAQTVGLVFSTSIAPNQKGFIMMQGLLEGLSTLPTSTWSDGDPVYLGATAGSKTPIKPYAPNHLVYLGVVTTANNGSAGRMYVRVQNGYELSEIHDVDLVSVAPTNGQVLQYVTGTPNLWKPRSIFGQIFIECNGQGGVVQPGYTGVSDITFDGIITGWTIYSVNPSTGAALSGSIDIDILSDSSFIPTTSLFPIAGNRPKLTTQTNNSATGLSIAVTQGHKIRARVLSATTCVLVNLQLQVTRT